MCTDVFFAPPAEVSRLCTERGVSANGLQTCGAVDMTTGWAWIVAPTPADFNDTRNLGLPGEEMLRNLKVRPGSAIAATTDPQ